jgi:hypothetical protein
MCSQRGERRGIPEEEQTESVCVRECVLERGGREKNSRVKLLVGAYCGSGRVPWVRMPSLRNGLPDVRMVKTRE